MNIGAILIGFALLFLSVPYVARPFLEERRKKPDLLMKVEPEAVSERGDVFIALRDLDFDFQTGKVTQEDYESLRSQLMVEAAEQIQEKQQNQAETSAREAELEALIRARKDTLSLSLKCARCNASLRPNDLFCPTCGEPVGTVCPSCGKRLSSNDHFCSSCGTPIEIKAENK